MRSIFYLILRRAKPVSKDGRRTRAFFSTPLECLRQPGLPHYPVCRVGGLDLPFKRAAGARQKTDNLPPVVGHQARRRSRRIVSARCRSNGISAPSPSPPSFSSSSSGISTSSLARSDEHTFELQSLMRISYAFF